MNANEQYTSNLPYGEQLVEREPIDETPFTLVGSEDTGWFIGLGTYRLTESQPTKDEAINLLKTKFWDIVIIICSLTHEVILKELVYSESKTK